MSRADHEYAAVFTHRVLGRMVRLTVADDYRFNLTFQEAQALARALAAVKDKRSSVDEVYLSPIGSDGDFHAEVRPDGLVIGAMNPPLVLDWGEVGAIADALAAAVPENAASRSADAARLLALATFKCTVPKQGRDWEFPR